MMTLYATALCPVGHAVRLVLAEKDVNVDVRFTEGAVLPEDLRALNPYGEVLTLVDRDLVLYEWGVMVEYLDERFPHPPLMPLDPAARATIRQLRCRLARDLLSLATEALGANEVAAAGARKALRDQLTALSPVCAHHRHFFSDDFTLVDCVMAPLLWRLGLFGIQLPDSARPLLDYAESLFARPAFKASLSESERRLATA